MKRIILYLGIITGAIHTCASGYYIYRVTGAVNQGFSLIAKYADFSVFTTKIYFDVYSPYVIQLLFCLLLALFCLFYFFTILKSKLFQRKVAAIALAWCLLNIALISSSLTLNIFFTTPSIPASKTTFMHVMMEPTSLPYSCVFYTSLLMASFMIFNLWTSHARRSQEH
jgi:hypothetical protein